MVDRSGAGGKWRVSGALDGAAQPD